jgi:two-component system chemotaxis response regulator CheY
MSYKALVANSSSKERKNIARSLKEIGVSQIVEATDGDQAIELLDKGSFNLVFAEWNAQTGTGGELLKALRIKNQSMPIIATVPQSQSATDLKKTCPSATNFITMPFTTEQLKKTIGQYVPTLAS